MNLKTIDSLLWKCKSLGCEAPAITLEDNDGAVVIKQWECGDIQQPTPEEADSIDAEWKLSNDYLVWKFNPDLAIAREAQVFTQEELDRFSSVSYTINELIRFKNFWGGEVNGVPYVGLQQMGNRFITSGKITQSDYDKLAGILAEQGIVLNR